MRTINLGTTQVATTTERVQVGNEAPKIAVQCIATGAPSAITADFEGSLDGDNWGVIETHAFSADELTALSKFFYITDKPVPYYRVSISTLTLVAREVLNPAVVGTGDGELTLATAVDSAPVEIWTLTCTAIGPSATFTVVGSVSGAQTNATSAVAYDNSIVAFTITDGATAWAVDDVITFNVAIVGGVTTITRYDDN